MRILHPRSPVQLESKQIFWFVLFLVILFFGIQLLFPSQRVAPFGIGLPAPMSTFFGEYVSFSIEYPANWSPSELPQGSHGDKEVFASISNNGFFPSAVFERRDFPNGSVKEVAEWGEQRRLGHNQITNYKSISLTKIETSNLDGLIRQYTWVRGFFENTIIKCEDLYVLDDEIGYTVSFCAKEKDWEKVEPYFQQMIESFNLH